MPETNRGKKLITWTFPEIIKHERSRGWYIAAIIIGVLLLIYALFTFNLLFALIIIVTAIILFLRHKEGVSDIDFTIYEDGVEIGNNFHEFRELRDFYVIYEPPEVKNLYLNFRSALQPRLQIPLDDINPVKVREILLDYLNEDLDKENEPITDALGRWLKL